MNVVKNTSDIFSHIDYIPEYTSKNPALIIQLHGAGERGDGNEDLDKVLIYGFSNIVNDENLRDEDIFRINEKIKDLEKQILNVIEG